MDITLSVITPTYNVAGEIACTLDSLVDNKVNILELVIVDGGSTDGTLEIVGRYKDKLNIKIISEPDDGIYDAMNKGILKAQGTIINFLAAGDFWNSDASSKVIEIFSEGKTDILAGSTSIYSAKNDGIKDFFRSKDLLSIGNPSVKHAGIFYVKDLHNKYGLYDLSFKVSADYELMSRFLNAGARVTNVDYFLTNIKEFGFSGLIGNLHIKKLEHIRIQHKYGGSSLGLVLFILKSLKMISIAYAAKIINKLNVSKK